MAWGEHLKKFFSDSIVQPNQKHWKTFVCPVYVLESNLQSGHIQNKWKKRSRVGIYLGRYLQHSQSVALMLEKNTGLVSPQFHLSFDPSFYTVKQDKLDSKCELKAGFVTQREPNALSNPSKGVGKNGKRAPPEEHTDQTPPNLSPTQPGEDFIPDAVPKSLLKRR